MSVRSRIASAALASGAIACLGLAGWWWVGADRDVFYTDDSAIRSSLPDASPRDVLWQPPVEEQTLDDAPIRSADAFVTPDGLTLLLARPGPGGDSDLFLARREADHWTAPQPIAAINSPDNELSPALTPDGKRLYFATDRPGGAGGLDIWVSEREAGNWLPPQPCAFNSAANDTDPAAVPPAGSEPAAVLFASDRPAEPVEPEVAGEPTSAAPPASYDLFRATANAEPQRLSELSSPADDRGPALSPSGDFLYFASDRAGGTGGTDLYRARVRRSGSTQPDAPPFGPAEPLGESINTPDNERSPSVSLEGFAVHFATDRDGQPALHRAVSREVYLSRTTTHGDLLRLLPWILLATAAVLLLSLVRAGVRDVRWQARLGTLGLMAKCALVSLVLHAGLLALLAALHVPETTGERSTSGGRVTLASSSLRTSIAGQLRDNSADISIEPAEILQPPARAASATDSPAPVAFQIAASTRATQLVNRSPTDIGAAAAQTAPPSDTVFDATLASSPTPALPTMDAGSIALPRHEAAALTVPETADARDDAPPLAAIDLASLGTNRRATAGAVPAAEFDIEAPAEAYKPPAGLSGIQSDGLAFNDAPAAAAALTLPPADEPGIAVAAPSPALALPGAGEDINPVAAPDTAEAEPSRAGLPLAEAAHLGSPAETGRVQPAMHAHAVAPFAHELIGRSRSPDVPDATSAAEPPPLAAPFAATDGIPIAMPELGGLSLPEVVTNEFDLAGTVLDRETGRPLAGAVVKLDLADAHDVVTRTAADGAFRMAFDDIPDNSAITATHPGYAPGAINIAEDDLDSDDPVVIRLDPIDLYTIALEQSPEVHHLGDDEFTGSINSQFQRNSEGLTLDLDFTITPEHAKLRLAGAEIRLMVKGSQLANRVRVNGKQAATLDESPRDGGFGEQVIPVPSGALRLGRNTITLESVDSRRTDHDDYEFVNVRVILIPADEHTL